LGRRSDLFSETPSDGRRKVCPLSASIRQKPYTIPVKQAVAETLAQRVRARGCSGAGVGGGKEALTRG
jgi:hypothetical protein